LQLGNGNVAFHVDLAQELDQKIIFHCHFSLAVSVSHQ